MRVCWPSFHPRFPAPAGLPAFETQEAGVAFTLETVAFEEGPTLTTTLQYETQLIDPTRPPELARVTPFGAAGQAVLRRHGRSRYRANTKPKHSSNLDLLHELETEKFI